MKHSYFISAFRSTVLSLVLLIPIASLAVPPNGGGGGPNKVSVTNADPGEAYQGEELEVTVTGSGFDSGSQVSYLVTGTTDSSQVDVLSMEFLSDTELKTRIKVKDAAIASDYDIEVRTSSGRKGKGTTLLKVLQSQSACLDTTPSFFFKSVGFEPITELRLSSRTGCNQILMASFDTRVVGGADAWNLDIRGETGFVSWIRVYENHSEIHGLSFDLLPGGQVEFDEQGPQLLYTTLPGGFGYISGIDAHMSDEGEVIIVFIERLEQGPSRIATLNPTTLLVQEISSGECQIVAPDGDCFVAYSEPAYDPTGEQIYFIARNTFTANNRQYVARFESLGDETFSSRLIVEDGRGRPSVSIEGVLAYGYLGTVCTGKGRQKCQTSSLIGLLEPGQCADAPCAAIEGQLGVDRPGRKPSWTSDGTLLFELDGVQEYIDPVLAVPGNLDLRDGQEPDSDL